MKPQQIETIEMKEAEKLVIETNSMDDLPPIRDTVLGDSDAEVAIILQHGYSGTNLELIYLGNYLALQGYRVLIPLLPGHGLTSDALLDVTPQNWIDKVIEAYDFLKEERMDRKIIAAGHSLGGALSFILAAEREIFGIISIAGPVRYRWYLRILGKLGSRFKLKIPFDTFKFHNKAFHEHPGIKYFIENYGRTPLKSLGDVMNLLNRAYSVLPQLEQPTCLIYSKYDNTVPPYHADIIRKRIGSVDLEMHWLSRSYHIMVIDTDRLLMSQKIANFVKRITTTERIDFTETEQIAQVPH